MGSVFLFIPLAVIAIVAALGMLLSRNAVYSALFLILNFATMSVFYILLNAPFLAMVQITVYAGAIMVLFLFVIMLLGAESGEGIMGTGRWQLPLAIFLSVVLVGSFIGAMFSNDSAVAAAELVDSSPTNLALTLFSTYVFPFEVTGILLLVAVVGLFVLSKKLKKAA
jgi:NADH-quinone oxidoreductase subunit J